MTTLTRHPGGASVQVHARIDESFTLVYDALVSRNGAAIALPMGPAVGAAPSPRRRGPVVEEPEETEAVLHDNLTAGAGIACGLREVVAGLR